MWGKQMPENQAIRRYIDKRYILYLEVRFAEEEKFNTD
jgi:hypothetical protein